ncbi:hypothetical protein UFOVP71_195 [uncultured Caudovirales phage]|uniref:Uncharacterized protein n=1 Tax=uncultured Caudovirales phage TaxID=2100421 RepID=A0A6J5TCI4_9CAUD|nr:hypothetical protein UFOVP71_195 [uncultured Caudovirales phage]
MTRKNKTLLITFADEDYTQELEYSLVDSPATTVWLEQIAPILSDSEQLLHLGVATMPTPERVKRHWDIVRHFVHQANQDHLLDEWIHLSEVLDLERNYQSLFNELRNRCQAYERYAKANNQISLTRKGLNRASIAIDIFELVLNSKSPIHMAWFKSKINKPFVGAFDAGKYLSSSVKAGDLVMTSSMLSRTLTGACQANDPGLLRRRMIDNWTPSSFTMLAFSDFGEDLDATNKWINEQVPPIDGYTATPSYCKIGKLETKLSEKEIVAMLMKAKIDKIEIK